MQYGSVTREERKKGPDVWSYRWWEAGPDRKRIHRRLVIGTVKEFRHGSLALKAVAGLRTEINARDPRINIAQVTMAELADHYRQRELTADSTWNSYATRYGYNVYLTKWIVPRWGEYPLASIKAIEVEVWLRQLPLAPSTCTKLRDEDPL